MTGSLDSIEKQKRLFVLGEIKSGQAAKLMNVIAAFDKSTTYNLVAVQDLNSYASFRLDLVIIYFLSGKAENLDLLLRSVDEHIKNLPHIPLAIITDSRDFGLYRECYRRGVRGLLHVGMNIGRVRTLLHLIADGGTFVPEVLLRPNV